MKYKTKSHPQRIVDMDDIRKMAEDIIGREDFIGVYVNAPVSVCEQRDVKGLYKKARSGEIKNFTGLDSPYEPPLNPELVIDSVEMTIEQAADTIIDFVETIGEEATNEGQQ